MDKPLLRREIDPIDLPSYLMHPWTLKVRLVNDMSIPEKHTYNAGIDGKLLIMSSEHILYDTVRNW